MTLGERIQKLRKQRGMSQESLGDALGVSRQAVSKWEGDNGIPELDTLIAMSRLFDVTLGQLLGVEESTEHRDDTANDADEDKVESVLRRYVEQTTKKTERTGLSRWGWVVSAAIVLTTVFIVMFAKLTSLGSTVKLLQSDLASFKHNVSNDQNNLSGQIRNAIYDILAEEASLLSTFNWKIVDYDLDKQTVTLHMDATMKEYSVGSKLQFCTTWYKTDDTVGQTAGEWVDGPNFQSDITIPLNHRTEVGIRVEDKEGNIKEQILQNPIYELHPDNFRLHAYNLTTPFAITVKGFAVSTSTAKAERAYIEIASMIPDFFWPEKAVLKAYVNGEEVMSETMTIIESDREYNVFLASIKDTYYDITLKEGDEMKVELTVTDNLGREEQFFNYTRVKDGQLEREAENAPTVIVG